MTSTLDSVVSSARAFTENSIIKSRDVSDGLFPPEKRAALLAKLQEWAAANPKVAAFLATNFALTGIPLLAFAVFTITVLVFSLTAALFLGALVALTFTVFCVGVALIFLLPTVLLTTIGATFLFLWGLGGYYVLKWFNEDEVGNAKKGTGSRNKVNNWTDGRMEFQTNGAKGQDQKEDREANGGINKTLRATGADDAPKRLSGTTSVADIMTNGADGATEDAIRVNKTGVT
ncbi:MAG: hypothetical protein M1820_010331 [Bogoriella megaspora]|nr:MAG: hypothetical protein M1820_010331 [Bogoriella megaspora]